MHLLIYYKFTSDWNLNAIILNFRDVFVPKCSVILRGAGVAHLVWLLGYGLDDNGWIPVTDSEGILFATVSRPTLGPTQSPIQWVPGALSLGGGGLSDWGMKLTTHLHLMPKLRIGGAIPPLPEYVFMA
jgi:hypothetical protein